jgi:clan AA aspartic protease (TIGR02281 family)
MNTRLTLLSVFVAGLVTGWFGHDWLATEPSMLAQSTGDNSQNADNQNQFASAVSPQRGADDSTDNSATADSNPLSTGAFSSVDSLPQQEVVATGDTTATSSSRNSATDPISDSSSGTVKASVEDTFDRLIDERLYRDAITLYQDQEIQNSSVAPQLRLSLIERLKQLIESRNNSDFSALIEQYLSVYYDDVEILLLLADFNEANGSYLEVVNVYLLAKTYAYTDIDLQNVNNRFNRFVEGVDNSYTSQRNWWSLINFYSHVDTSGLMTSTHQYQLALAHLRSGDEILAVDQLNQLLNDSVVGESAALALNNLANNLPNTADGQTAAPIPDHNAALGQSESIPLQQLGNQYVVGLTTQRQDNIRLLIDTGASMTAISAATFNALGLSADATAQERRVFRTAGGVITGTVYSIPELQLGSYLLQNTQIAVIDFETEREIDGLLGMNILGQFRFQIDQENARLQLSRK